MGVIYALIPIAILLTGLGIYLFFWAVKTDQFDDLEKQGLSILFDEDTNENNTSTTQKPESEEQVEPDQSGTKKP
ncbi:cbb3-type cytochrome oxidase assembly protein CcoS [Thalassotalea piscium]|uniref:Cbb3-type cytochrome oxidase maturation protein n=1 Tax=Thalassotalea piscium TaxID=1230533 RepID=A0A7X0TSJ0_9GAMM|nr:cbb3-type cytochrome oxidase assembly protein CcoS [Thalassotalea piscium]MBB6542177.1 cbb3-type cytochrome oxidase maturation protein [Thalassotalea piscium]